MRCITWWLAVLNYNGMTSGRKRTLTTVGGLKKQEGIYFKELDVRSKHLSLLSLATIVFTLAACGGGGGGGNRGAGTVAPPAPVQSDFEQGVFQAQSMFAAMCEIPRVGSSDAQGSTENENEWLRAWSHDLYLWYDEIIDEDPAAHTTPAYFDLMRTFATTPSGADKDQFHFTYDTEEWELLSQQGISAGYGADVVLIASSPPRRAVVALVQPGSPAAGAGVTRGSAIVEVDGADLVNGDDVDTLNAGLFPSGAGESHDFMIEDFDGSNRRAITLVSTEVTEETVP
ncbi:MAG: carboxyl-terminal processing protease, partial [Limisphaerales bacterium]